MTRTLQRQMRWLAVCGLAACVISGVMLHGVVSELRTRLEHALHERDRMGEALNDTQRLFTVAQQAFLERCQDPMTSPAKQRPPRGRRVPLFDSSFRVFR